MQNPNIFEGYRITSSYGPRKDPFTDAPTFHTGIDLVKSKYAPIPAFVSGEVIHAKEGVQYSGFGNFGIVVAVKDKYGALHCYAHLNSARAAVGQRVEAGQVIGFQGNTGRSTGSHLHYEVRRKSLPSYGFGTNTDPGEYLVDYFAKEQEHMIPVEKAKKIITMIQAAWMEADCSEKKEVLHDLANEVRKASGQKPQ